MQETIIFLSKSTELPVNGSSGFSDFFIAVFGAIVGATLSFIFVAFWERRKEHKRYRDFSKLVLLELKLNYSLIEERIDDLPEDIKDKMEKSKQKKEFFSDKDIYKLHWNFSKFYSTDSWKNLVLSGLSVNLSDKIFNSVHEAYNLIDTINHSENLSMNLFKIMSLPNKLDEETNKNFDRFCRIGVRSYLLMAEEKIKKAIEQLERELK